MKNRYILLSALLFAGLSLTAQIGHDGDDNTVRSGKVRTPATGVKMQPTNMSFQATTAPQAALPRSIRRTDRAGLLADFSIQGGVSQEVVWQENFEGGIGSWTQDNGEGGVVVFELKEKADYAAINSESTQSLHIDGPYQTFRRTIGHLTSAGTMVPTNGMLHAYLWADPFWNGYATLSLSVSADQFATSTELWNSASLSSGESGWHKVEADLSAFVGQTIQVRLTYGPGTDDVFNTGGYMGDFYADDISITGVNVIDQVVVKTGETISFVDLSTGGPSSWQWSFPGGTPATSTDQNPEVFYTAPGTYDVTLTASNGEGSAEVTKTAFVTVEGQQPTAGTGYPAEFRDINTRMRMIAPLMPVQYTDLSEGYPTGHSWSFYTPYDLAKSTDAIFTPEDMFFTPDVEYTHKTLDKCYVTHIVDNEVGYSFTDDSVQVQFDGLVGNFMPGDGYQTNFTDGDLTLPGANNMGVTAYAEKFSKPAVPALLEAMYINFTKASAEELTEQLSDITFYLYTVGEDGLPGEKVDILDIWNMSELNYAMTTNNGIVTMELDHPYVIDDAFFVVIDGIPAKTETLECAIGMAPLRSEGNTAYMLNKGVWRPFTGYFQAAPGGQTSLAVFPYLTYSVLTVAEVDGEGRVTPAEAVVHVPAQAGADEVAVYHYMALQYEGADDNWVRLTGSPGEYTVDNVAFEYDALPEGMQSRETFINLTDGITHLKIKVVQDVKTPTGISVAQAEEMSQPTETFGVDGRRLGQGDAQRGITILRQGKAVRKVVRP